MPYRFLCLGLFVSNAAVFPLTAETTPDYNALLQRLEVMQDERNQKVASAIETKQRELSKLIQSSNAAVRAYQKAYRYQHHNDDKEEHNRWKEIHKDLHDEDMFEDAVRLHLQYLLLTLDLIQARDQAEQREKLLPELIDYLQATSKWDSEVAELEKPMSKREAGEKKIRQSFFKNQITPKNLRELMKVTLAESPFVKEYQLEEHMKGLKDWEEVPGNIDGILDKTVFPELRKTKDPRLMELWSERLERRENRARLSENIVTIDRFINIQKPQLLWRWSQDMLILGKKGKAYENMVTILEEYPGHAKYDDWMKKLTEKLQAETGTQAAN